MMARVKVHYAESIDELLYLHRSLHDTLTEWNQKYPEYSYSIELEIGSEEIRHQIAIHIDANNAG